MQSACTSLDMQSGAKPLASIVRAVLNANDPMPWPMSKMTPRLRASITAGRTPPSGVVGLLGNGRKQWVRMSPGLKRSSTSSSVGGGTSICAMSGQARFLGDLERDVERHGPRILRRVEADPDFDAADRVAVRQRDLDRVDRRHEPEVAALSHHHPLGKAVNAGKGDVEKGDDPNRRRPDHMFEKARIIARPGAARIDERRAAPSRENERIDAERRAAPIDMRVKVDQPRRDDAPATS